MGQHRLAESNPMELTPLQMGVGAVALAALGYFVYTKYYAVEDVPAVGDMQAISLTTDVGTVTVDTEAVTPEDVATEVVVPDLTKAEWLKAVKALPWWKRESKVAKGLTVAKSALVKTDTTFFAMGKKGASPVVAVGGQDQILTVSYNTSPTIKKVMYFLARPDTTLIELGSSLVKPLSSIKVTPSTKFYSVSKESVGVKQTLTPEQREELTKLLKRSASRVPELQGLKESNKLSKIVVKSVHLLPSDTILTVTVKGKDGKPKQSAKQFKANDRLVCIGGPEMLEICFVVGSNDKVTSVKLMQPARNV